MSQPRDDRQDDLFRPPLNEIINLRHPLCGWPERSIGIFWRDVSARCVAWDPGSRHCRRGWWLGCSFSSTRTTSPTRRCATDGWRFQYFCGEVVFRHELPFDRSSLTRWRQRLGEEQIAALLQESLSVAHRSGAIATEDLERVAVVPPYRRRRSHIRPMPGLPTARSRSWWSAPSARALSCARAICGWPSGPPSWWGATRMPTNSNAPGGN